MLSGCVIIQRGDVVHVTKQASRSPIFTPTSRKKLKPEQKQIDNIDSQLEDEDEDEELIQIHRLLNLDFVLDVSLLCDCVKFFFWFFHRNHNAHQQLGCFGLHFSILV